MTGEYGPNTLYRAAKADFLSLAFFEIGLFNWMAIFQIAIFKWKLQMNTITYWWMMQVRCPKVLETSAAKEAHNDTGRHVPWPLDSVPHQLVVNQSKYQRTLCLGNASISC